MGMGGQSNAHPSGENFLGTKVSMDFTIIIPFYNGHDTILKLLNSLPVGFPIILVDDRSEKSLREVFREDTLSDLGCKIITLSKKGYFSGAVNAGINSCSGDVLIINQDSHFEDHQFFNILEEKSKEFALIGERISGYHPAWEKGYIHGTLMYIRRDALNSVGLLDQVNFPLWGSTAEWQARACRKGFKVLPLQEVPGFSHDRKGNFGSSIKQILLREPEKQDLLIRTPPLISVIVPCYNYGRYLKDCINSLVGGETSAGKSPGQTIQGFEIIIVDDLSTDDTPKIGSSLADPWKGIRYYRTPINGGTAYALNFGISKSYGKFITFLSADDMREPEGLERLLEPLKSSEKAFSYDDVTLLVHGKRNPKTWKMPEEYTLEGLLYKNVIHSSIMFPYQAWKDTGGYPEIMNDGREDWAFNIALNLKGYCGTHVNYAGLLYRRDGQNRSLGNTNPVDREKFLKKLKSLFTDAYAGRFPMGCCGGGNSVPAGVGRKNSRGTYVTEKSLPGSSGMQLLEYQGSNFGNQTYYGPVTGTIYIFSAKKNRRNVDVRDLVTQRGTGLLQLTDRGRMIFKKVKEVKPVPVPVPVPIPVPVPEPLPEPVAEIQSVVSESQVLVEESSSSEYRIAMFELTQIAGIDDETIELLMGKGIYNPERIVERSVEDLSEILGWTKTRTKALKSMAKKYLEAKRKSDDSDD